MKRGPRANKAQFTLDDVSTSNSLHLYYTSTRAELVLCYLHSQILGLVKGLRQASDKESSLFKL